MRAPSSSTSGYTRAKARALGAENTNKDAKTQQTRVGPGPLIGVGKLVSRVLDTGGEMTELVFRNQKFRALSLCFGAATAAWLGEGTEGPSTRLRRLS
jgi:hypothetical protein